MSSRPIDAERVPRHVLEELFIDLAHNFRLFEMPVDADFVVLSRATAVRIRDRVECIIEQHGCAAEAPPPPFLDRKELTQAEHLRQLAGRVETFDDFVRRVRRLNYLATRGPNVGNPITRKTLQRLWQERRV